MLENYSPITWLKNNIKQDKIKWRNNEKKKTLWVMMKWKQTIQHKFKIFLHHLKMVHILLKVQNNSFPGILCTWIFTKALTLNSTFTWAKCTQTVHWVRWWMGILPILNFKWQRKISIRGNSICMGNYLFPLLLWSLPRHKKGEWSTWKAEECSGTKLQNAEVSAQDDDVKN